MRSFAGPGVPIKLEVGIFKEDDTDKGRLREQPIASFEESNRGGKDNTLSLIVMGKEIYRYALKRRKSFERRVQPTFSADPRPDKYGNEEPQTKEGHLITRLPRKMARRAEAISGKLDLEFFGAFRCADLSKDS
jgi:hypothetical protein